MLIALIVEASRFCVLSVTVKFVAPSVEAEILRTLYRVQFRWIAAICAAKIHS